MRTTKFRDAPVKSYDEIKNQIKPGDIFFASGDYWVSRMIKKFSDSDFSHVGIVFRWNDKLILFESVEDDGVRAVPLSQYVNNYENSGKKYDGKLYIGRLQEGILNEAKARLVLAKAIDFLNRSYDKDGVAKIAARIALGIKPVSDDDKEFICSELVEKCFDQVNITFDYPDNTFIFPEHIAADRKVEALFEIK